MPTSNKLPKQKILFSSVLGPYGVESHRSRLKNPMSLLSNQVTRGQMYYTVQMSQRTFAFDLFAVNLNAEVAIIDFPSEKYLERALRSNSWDRVGLASIPANFEALLDTYTLVRSVLPDVFIDIGGHMANDETVVWDWIQEAKKRIPTDKFQMWIPDFEKRNIGENGNADSLNLKLAASCLLGDRVTFIKRDGLEFYSQKQGIGLKSQEKLWAPLVDASFGKRVMGIPLGNQSAGLLIPDVGCPLKCNFCATSAKFEGKFVQFLKTAEDIQAVARAHFNRGKTEMFVLSENFSLDTRRAFKLLELMEKEKTPHLFSVFSSANGLAKIGTENLVKLGYSFVWIGLEESSGKAYSKMHGIDLMSAVTDYQDHGIEILGSTILGFEGQNESDLYREIEHALSYQCVYNQFMLYCPVPGTPFYNSKKSEGQLKRIEWADFHGQAIQNWQHPSISPECLEKAIDAAFQLDFEKLGPSLFRMMKVQYDGYQKTEKWPHELVQMRRKLAFDNFIKYIPLLSAMESDLKKMKHCKWEQVQRLKETLVVLTGKRGYFSLKFGTPFARVALQVEKQRYFRNLKSKRHPTPKTQFTIYGDLKNPWSRKLHPWLHSDLKIVSAFPGVAIPMNADLRKKYCLKQEFKDRGGFEAKAMESQF